MHPPPGRVPRSSRPTSCSRKVEPSERGVRRMRRPAQPLPPARRNGGGFRQHVHPDGSYAARPHGIPANLALSSVRSLSSTRLAISPIPHDSVATSLAIRVSSGRRGRPGDSRRAVSRDTVLTFSPPKDLSAIVVGGQGGNSAPTPPREKGCMGGDVCGETVRRRGRGGGARSSGPSRTCQRGTNATLLIERGASHHPAPTVPFFGGVGAAATRIA